MTDLYSQRGFYWEENISLLPSKPTIPVITTSVVGQKYQDTSVEIQ